MKKHRLYCKPLDGKFNWERSYDLRNLPAKLYKYGRVKVTFEKYVPKKSLKQLGYYHAGVLPFLTKTLFDDTGMSKDDWHRELKEKFGIRETSKCGRFEKIKSNAEYSEKEMAFYITQVIDWTFHFFGLHVPPAKKIEDYL